MSDLDRLMIQKRAFNERIPMSESAAMSGSGLPAYRQGSGLRRAGGSPAYRQGSGLMRAGGFAVPPALVTAAMPALQDLAKTGIQAGIKELPKLPKLVFKGIKKVGSFFKKLFGGAREHEMFNPDGTYHDLPLYRGEFKPEDRSLPFQQQQRIKKYNSRFEKIKGGFAPIDPDRLRTMIMSDEKFAKRLGKLHRKPHRFLNLINRKMAKAANKKKA